MKLKTSPERNSRFRFFSDTRIASSDPRFIKKINHIDIIVALSHSGDDLCCQHGANKSHSAKPIVSSYLVLTYLSLMLIHKYNEKTFLMGAVL